MKRFRRVVRLFSLAVFAFLPGISFASEPTPISTGRYVTGGILGSAIGFGVGHAVQKRYLPLGIIFTVGETAGFVAAILDSRVDTYDDGIGNITKEFRIGTAGLVGLSVMVGLHVWEILDVWINGARARREAGAQPIEEPKVSVVPVSGSSSTPGMSVLVRF